LRSFYFPELIGDAAKQETLVARQCYRIGTALTTFGADGVDTMLPADASSLVTCATDTKRPVLNIQCMLCSSQLFSPTFFSCCQRLLCCWACCRDRFGLPGGNYFSLPSDEVQIGTAKCPNRECEALTFQIFKVEIDNATYSERVTHSTSLVDLTNDEANAREDQHVPRLLTLEASVAQLRREFNAFRNHVRIAFLPVYAMRCNY
jgi:hypothetical protein